MCVHVRMVCVCVCVRGEGGREISGRKGFEVAENSRSFLLTSLVVM